MLDTTGEVGQHYRVTGMPTTFFIDSEGNIAAAGRGMVTEEALREQLANLGLEHRTESESRPQCRCHGRTRKGGAPKRPAAFAVLSEPVGYLTFLISSISAGTTFL
ncbi:MAG: hypothetical protein U5Q44_04435 [Dehalococcoidia bacterium]|nr:hypothetical protein [Dehalococcoidia bacterium]